MVRYLGFWVLVFLAIAILFIGYWLELHYQDDHFQRSGSLVVFLAILIEAREMKLLYQIVLTAYKTTNEQIAGVQSNQALFWKCLDRFSISGRTPLNEAMETTNKIIDQRDGHYIEADEFKKLVFENTKAFERISIVAFFTGLLGTIVWGYGDIIMKWMSKI